jgi:hypothetical protein
MAKIHRIDEVHIEFHCPGCKQSHSIPAARWNWNGDIDSPTLSPSLLRRTGHFVDGDSSSCWCTFNAERRAAGERESGFECAICHSFVRSGMIEFLNDCTHDLKGQTVEIPDWGNE